MIQRGVLKQTTNATPTSGRANFATFQVAVSRKSVSPKMSHKGFLGDVPTPVILDLGLTSPGSLNEKSSKPEVSAAGVGPAAEIGPTEPAEVKSATTEVVTSAGVAPREVHVAATGV